MATILVVDDEPAVRALLRDILELDGHDVREAVDGPSALADLAGYRPDLVLLDVMMPGMSGIEVLTAVRADPCLRDLPIAMLTAAGDDRTTWQGWTAGASVYLTKPFEHENLLLWIERLLEAAVLSPAS